MLKAHLTKLITFPRLVEIDKAQKIVPKNNPKGKFNNDLNIFINLGLLILMVVIIFFLYDRYHKKTSDYSSDVNENDNELNYYDSYNADHDNNDMIDDNNQGNQGLDYGNQGNQGLDYGNQGNQGLNYGNQNN